MITHPVTVGTRQRLGAGRRPRPSYPVIVIGSVVLASISLAVLPRGIAYDPWSWLVWGRQIFHLHLDTRGAATAVKPLPIGLTALFAVTGKAAPDLWLLVARAAAIAGVGLAFRLAERMAGVLAGLLAAAGVVTIEQYSSYLFFAGMSEPMATATALLAADAALARRHRLAFVALILTGLLRVEAWPIAIGYAAWRIWRHPSLGRLAGSAAALLILPVAWFGIDWLGSGTLRRSAEAASHQSQGGPLLSANPGLATVTETVHILLAPLAVAGVLTWLYAMVRFRDGGWTRAAAGFGLASLTWLAVTAVMAQARVATGAFRYLIPAAAVVAVIGAVGFARAGRALLPHRPAIAAIAAVVVVLGGGVPQLIAIGQRISGAWSDNQDLQTLADNMPRAVRLAGGGAAMSRCGHVAGPTFQVPVVVWSAGLHFRQVDVQPAATGTIIQQAGQPAVPRGSAYRKLGSVGRGVDRLTVYSTCRSPAR